MAPSAPLPALLLPRAQGKAGMGARDAAQPAARCDLTHPHPNPPPQAGEGAVIPAANTRFAPRLRAGGRATHREPPLCSFPRARGKAGMGANGAAPPAARCDLTHPPPQPSPASGEGAVSPAANTRSALAGRGGTTHRERPLCPFPRSRGKAGMGASGAMHPAVRCNLARPRANPLRWRREGAARMEGEARGRNAPGPQQLPPPSNLH